MASAKIGLLRIELKGGYVIGTTNIADNEWHHITIVQNYPNAARIELYVDGILESASEIFGQTIQTTEDLDVTFGVYLNQPIYYKGLLDEVRLYSRALRPDEIQDLANNR